MQLIITGKNVHVTRSLKTYTEKKIGKLDHYMPALMDAHVVFTMEKTKKAAQTHLVQVTLRSNGSILRGEQRAYEFPAAVDAVMDKLYKEIDRWKDKHYRSRAKGERIAMGMFESSPARTGLPQIVRRKRFVTKSMTEKQALKAMNALGHEFYFFLNRATNQLNVLYRRRDNNYGLIEPDYKE